MSTQRIQFRRDTGARWLSVNPVLASGELGLDTSTNRYKIGDGATAWNGLPYQADFGPSGPQGPAGPMGSLSMGTVATGSPAAATITGPIGAQLLNLTIPPGPAGSAGPQGASGPANVLSIGTVTDGTTASATVTGSAPAQILNLVLPRGKDGAAGAAGVAGPVGPQGPKGDAAGVVIKGEASAWPPDASPTVGDVWVLTTVPVGAPAGYVPGDATCWTGSAWSNIGPIRGPAGADGSPGPAGPAGKDGAQGLPGPQGAAGPPTELFVATVVGAEGSNPSATITGLPPAQTITFTLPPPLGNTLTIGTVTEGAVAAATITGTPPNQVLNLVLPSAALTHSTSFIENPADATVGDGSDFTMRAMAQSTEAPIVYSWQYSTDGTTWNAIAGSGTVVDGKAELTLKASLAWNNRMYRCVAATPSVGSVYSLIATLRVRDIVSGGLSFRYVPHPGNGSDVLMATDLRINNYRRDWLGITTPLPAGFWEANGRAFTRDYSTTDGITWDKHVGGDPAWIGSFYPTRVDFVNGAYMMWRTNTQVELPIIEYMHHYASSDGKVWGKVNWGDAALQQELYAMFCMPYKTPTGLAWNNRRWYGDGTITDVTTSTTDGATHSQALINTYDPANPPTGAAKNIKVTVFSKDINGITCETKATFMDGGVESQPFTAYATTIGGNTTDAGGPVTDFAKGVIAGVDVLVAVTDDTFYVIPASGGAVSKITKAFGHQFDFLASVRGTWLAFHRNDQDNYYVSNDLVAWTPHALDKASWEWGSHNSIGRPTVIAGKVLYPMVTGSGASVESVNYYLVAE